MAVVFTGIAIGLGDLDLFLEVEAKKNMSYTKHSAQRTRDPDIHVNIRLTTLGWNLHLPGSHQE